jgi:hypothetical protein
MGRWDNSGRNYGKGLGSDEYSDISRELSPIKYCKRCRYHELVEHAPLESMCMMTGMKCMEALPACKSWGFKDPIPIRQQPILVAKDEH